MPCNADWCEPSDREKEGRLVCQLLEYLYECLCEDVPENIAFGAENHYGDVKNLDRNTAKLCEMIQGLSGEQTDEFVYNGRDKQARKLADWWERHQEYDRKRKDKEQKEIDKELLRIQALKKLTKKEREALGL